MLMEDGTQIKKLLISKRSFFRLNKKSPVIIINNFLINS